MEPERQRASAAPPMRAMFVPATFTSPDVGWSTPPIRFRSVVFPEPEGPMSATNSPSGMLSESPSSTRTSSASRRYTLITFWTSTAPMPRSSAAAGSALGQPDLHSILQCRGRLEHHHLAPREPLPDLDAVPARRSHVHPYALYQAVAHDPHRRAALAGLDRRLRHEHAAGRGLGRGAVRLEHQLGPAPRQDA